jgi:hypothetical protein
MTDTRASLGAFSIVGESSAALEGSLATSYVVGSFPAEFIEASQGFLSIAAEPSIQSQASQAALLVVGRGRVYNPKLRAWTYTLDGHDFYVLRLGDQETLVFDLTTEQWSRFTSGDLEFWRANTGMNWLDAIGLSVEYGSNVLVGDDTNGTLWFLDPDQGYDESVFSSEAVLPFPRVATGQMIAKSREYLPIFEVFLTGSNGFPAFTGAEVTLKYSDDAGNNYVSAGALEAQAGNYNEELSWKSLGRFSYPGRLFRIEDNGALARIDGLDVNHGATAS